MDQPLEAQVIDARHLMLKNPIEIPPGSKVLITIVPNKSNGNDDWFSLSIQQLEAAYGEDEPDYPLSLIKNPNAEFQQ